MYLANPYPEAGKVSVLSLTAELVDGSRRPVPLSDVRHTPSHIRCICLAYGTPVAPQGLLQGWDSLGCSARGVCHACQRKDCVVQCESKSKV